MEIPPELYAMVASEEQYADKEVIIDEDAYGDWMYIILEGQVQARKRTSAGMTTIDTYRQGEIIGEMNLLMNTSEKRSLSIIAAGPAVLGVLDSTKILADLNSLSPMLRKIIMTLTKRLHGATQKLLEIQAK